MNALGILGLVVAGAVTYGLLHDLVTAHVCVEYFTIGHAGMGGPPDPSPLAQALYWGWAATWPMGALLGVVLALAARAGPWPPRSPGSLVKPLLVVLGLMGLASLGAGLLGAALARAGDVVLVGFWEAAVPRERHVAFLANLWAHNAAYLAGGLLGLGLALRVVLVRRRAALKADAA